MSEHVQLDSEAYMKQTLAKVEDHEDIIRRAASQYRVRPEDIRAIISVESHGKDGQKASAKGAHGLMEIEPSTWKEMQGKHPELRKYDFARDWDTPEANIMVGAATLAAKREAVTRLGVPAELAVIAYNAGEGVVRYAYDHAKQAGSKNPELACTQREHVAYAVEMTGIWTYYMPPRKSASKNKSGTKEEAIRIKTNEILDYPTKIAAYLEEERREGLTSGSPKPAPTKSESTTPTKPKAPTEPKSSREPSGKGPHVEVTVSDLKPIRPGHIISDSVGEGGNNHQADVGTVQEALARHGHSPGKIDHKIGPNTIGAIRAFQAELHGTADGRVDVGGPTEKHLMDKATKSHGATDKPDDKRKAADNTEISTGGAAQMAKVEAIAASHAAGHPPHDHKCYQHVKDYIRQAGGYGNIRDVQADKRFVGAIDEAHKFADRVNSVGADKFGLEKLSVATPFEAPLGALVVVKHGTPGTKHPTAGDITVRGPDNDFYNSGTMHYGYPKSWPLKPGVGALLGVYKPK